MKRIKRNTVMNAILILVATVGLQFSGLFANAIGEVNNPSESTSLFCPECPSLAPEIPLEAAFNEPIEFYHTMNLSPVVPIEASFCDDLISSNDTNLAPVVPLTADFNDTF